MEDRIIKRELTAFVSLMFVFVLVLAGLKMYDVKTGQIQKIGSKVFSRFFEQT